MTIVTHGDHLLEVLRRVPDWWGVHEAVLDRNEVDLIPLRIAHQNPSPDGLALVQLLWRDEVLALLASRGLDIGLKSKPRAQAWTCAAQHIPFPELSEAVRTCLKARRWRQHAQSPLDVPQLSNGDWSRPSAM